MRPLPMAIAVWAPRPPHTCALPAFTTAMSIRSRSDARNALADGAIARAMRRSSSARYIAVRSRSSAVAVRVSGRSSGHQLRTNAA